MGRPVDLYDVRRVDAALGSTLEKLAAAAATAGVYRDSARISALAAVAKCCDVMSLFSRDDDT